MNLQGRVKSLVRNAARRWLPDRVYETVRVHHLPLLQARCEAVRHALSIGNCYPEELGIALTTRCNLRCFICDRDDFHGEDLDFSKLDTLRSAIRHAKTIDLTGWGEPFLYARCFDALKTIYELNPSPSLITLTTNGSVAKPAHAEALTGHLHGLTISLNAATAATYNRDMQHGDFARTTARVRDFVAAFPPDDRVKLRLHFVAHRENMQEIPEFVALAKNLDVSHVSYGHYLAKNRQHMASTLLDAREEYNRLLDAAVQLGGQLGVKVTARRFFHEKPRNAQGCLLPFRSCYVRIDGGLAPCCFSGSAVMGNAFEEGFEQVWFGDAYRKLRRSRNLPACRCCPEFLPLDAPAAHLTPTLKEENGLVQIERAHDGLKNAANHNHNETKSAVGT
jgi:MoaA/NifB/PqqE/SkfB family radical SAM enzyme